MGMPLFLTSKARQALVPGAAWSQHSLASLDGLGTLALLSNHRGESSGLTAHRSDQPGD